MNTLNNFVMKTGTTKHKNYEKPAIQEIQMVEEASLLNVSNYDGAETD